MDMQQIQCCGMITDAPSSARVDQLLRHMLVTDYYDGPTSGFLRCEACSSVYFFTTVAWNGNGFVRVIALASVPEDSWRQFISFFGETPSGPQWIPSMLARPSEEALDRVEGFLESITSQAGATTLILAWEKFSDKVLAARKVTGLPTPSDLNMFAPRSPEAMSAVDWFADLGMTLSDG
jgi:hypothetical protein